MVEQLRIAIRASGRSLRDLGASSKVGADIISRFIRGERGITLEIAGRLCDELGIELAIPPALTHDPRAGQGEGLPPKRRPRKK